MNKKQERNRYAVKIWHVLLRMYVREALRLRVKDYEDPAKNKKVKWIKIDKNSRKGGSKDKLRMYT